MSEPDKALVLARGFFHALPEEDDYEFHDEKYMTGTCDGCVPAAIVPADTLSAVTAERDRLARCLAFTEQWYAVRFERLADLGKSAGCWDAMAAIIANGTADSHEPPTYARQLVRANHRANVAERERDQLLAEVEALRKDAERYRWLRTYAYGHFHGEELEDLFSRNDSLVDEKVDEAIDAAMAAKDGQP